MRSSSSNQPGIKYPASTGVKSYSRATGSSKPPVAPKPVLHRSNPHRPLSEPKNDRSSAAGGMITDSFSPTQQRYSSYPSAVLIRDENVYDGYETVNTTSYGKLSSLPLMVPVSVAMGVTDIYARDLNSYSKSHMGILPPLSKPDGTQAHIITSVNTHTHEFLDYPRNGPSGRTLSASAKNALLMEKIRGNITYQDGFIQNQPRHRVEILPRAHSDPETNSLELNRSVVTVNNCINTSNINDNSNNNNNSIHSIRNSEIAINSIPIPLLPITTTYNNGCKFDVCSDAETCTHSRAGENCTKFQPLGSKRRDQDDTNYRSEICLEINGMDGGYGKISRQAGHKTPSVENKDSASLKELLSPLDEVDSSCSKAANTTSSAPAAVIASSQSAPCSPAAKPQLQKSEAVDMEDLDFYKKLSRGISKATENVNIVSKARSEIWDALEAGKATNNTPFFLETPVFTFTLPDLTLYSDEFRSFLEKDLIEMSTLVSLEAAGRLNWWAMIGAAKRLWPLATSGDGNCLLHAASLGMWGFHDRLLTLRKALYDFLTKSQFRQQLWRRWRLQVALQNRETGLVFNQSEWEAEWDSVLRLASSAPRGAPQLMQENSNGSTPNLCQNSDTLSQGKLNSDVSGPVYESLEEIHVLALAHVLRRPIIVVADTTLKDMNGDPLAPIPFGGIYLPFECPHLECQRSPLLLTYDAAHFSALVVMETSDKDYLPKSALPAIIPVTDCSHALLPIQFLIDPGSDFTWYQDEYNDKIIRELTMAEDEKKELLNKYLDLTHIPIPPSYLEAAASYCSQDGEMSESLMGDSNDADKKSSESSFDSDDGPPFFDGVSTLSTRVKAPKQLQTVVKSFGSIGRSMSKRIKKNLSKLSRTGSFRKKSNVNKGFRRGSKTVRVSTHQNYILAARIHTDKRHAYQEEMIENYLAAAKARYLHEKNIQKNPISDKVNGMSLQTTEPNEVVKCINSGCTLYGTAETCYMCSSCFSRQKEQEEKEYQWQKSVEAKSSHVPSNEDLPTNKELKDLSILGMKCDGLQYGAGKSKFYASLDEQSIKNATLIPTTQSVSGIKDKTLFLSNSTFYNDTSTIPSYNLNQDLKRELSRGEITRNKLSSESSGSRSSLNEQIPISKYTQERSSLSPVARDSLAPICIDDLRVNLNRSSNHKNVQKDAGTKSGKKESDIRDVVLPKNCLTQDCPFYGNPSTDSLCSKCHNAKKKSSQGTESYTLEQIKLVQI